MKNLLSPHGKRFFQLGKDFLKKDEIGFTD